MIVLPPVSREVWPPLKNGLTGKNTTSTGVTKTFSAPSNQCSLYAGDSFTVQVYQWFKLEKYVTDIEMCGIVTTNFLPMRDSMKTMQLTPGGYKILTVPNAGGSSVISEVLSFELLNKCFNARLKKTEMEVSYFPHGGSITDYVCEMFQSTVGVSVTRAMKYGGEYTIEDAQRLLNKKLKGVIQSSRNTLDHWNKQVLHVWSTSYQVTGILTQAYVELEDEVKANTVVMVTTAAKADYIFNNG